MSSFRYAGKTGETKKNGAGGRPFRVWRTRTRIAPRAPAALPTRRITATHGSGWSSSSTLLRQLMLLVPPLGLTALTDQLDRGGDAF